MIIGKNILGNTESCFAIKNDLEGHKMVIQYVMIFSYL